MLVAARRRWPDWRLAPPERLMEVGEGWEALGSIRRGLVEQLTEPEIEWATRATDVWAARAKVAARDGDLSSIPATLSIRHARPQAAIHVEAVRAALRDGRIDKVAWAAQAGLGTRVVSAWLSNEPLAASWEGRAWGAAVTTTVPGWSTHRDAMEPS
jgi:hypothetical protein